MVFKEESAMVGPSFIVFKPINMIFNKNNDSDVNILMIHYMISDVFLITNNK